MEIEKTNLDLNELNELEKLKVKISTFKAEAEESGFALLRGNNWNYLMKKLYCIIGRAPLDKNSNAGKYKI